MPTDVEYALFAGRAYFNVRSAVNFFPLPSPIWTESAAVVLPSGFEAVRFTLGSNVVISFAGTNPYAAYVDTTIARAGVLDSLSHHYWGDEVVQTAT